MRSLIFGGRAGVEGTSRADAGARRWTPRSLEGPPAPGRPAPGGTPRGSILVDRPGLRGDHLPAAVEAVRGHVVAQVDLARGGIRRQLLGLQRVVGTAMAAAGRGNTGFL